MGSFTESVVEDAAFAWLESLGYAVKHGPEIAPRGSKRTDGRGVVPADRERRVVAKNATACLVANVQKMRSFSIRVSKGRIG